MVEVTPGRLLTLIPLITLITTLITLIVTLITLIATLIITLITLIITLMESGSAHLRPDGHVIGQAARLHV